MFIKPLVETQRVRLGTTMVEICKTMLTTECDIRRRVENRRQLDRTYIDKNDIDPTTGTGKIKEFIPKNIRETPMPLNF